MVDQKNLDEIKEATADFFQKAGFSIEVESLSFKEETVFLSLKSEEPKVLIGKNGRILNDIQHLIKAILKKRFSENFFLNVDINDYKAKKIEYLKETAREAADEVALTKKEKIMLPMPACDRRIIHLTLSNHPDVVVESIGQEPERRIVIKPCP
jgi:spoIIIJ-associated protein